MKNIKSLSLILVLISLFGLNSCIVERGPAGPAGDQAINTFVTYNFNISSDTWVMKNGDNSTYLYYKSIPEITSNVINNGLVLAYARIDGKPWVQLPMTMMALSLKWPLLSCVSPHCPRNVVTSLVHWPPS